MAKKAAAAAPAATTDPTPDTPAAKISKANAVRAAVADGITTPEDGVAYIKTKFGMDVTKLMWSSYRAQDKARQKKKAADGEAAPAPKPRAVASSNGKASNPAELARQVKALVETYGAVAVKEMTDVFA
jgi:hypothetical protein